MRQDPFGPPETHQDLPQSSKTQWGPSRLAETFWSTPLPIGTWWNPLKTCQDPLWHGSPQVFGGLRVHQCISASFLLFCRSRLISMTLAGSQLVLEGLGRSCRVSVCLWDTGWYRMLQEETRWYHMVLIGIEWHQMEPNGTEQIWRVSNTT